MDSIYESLTCQARSAITPPVGYTELAITLTETIFHDGYQFQIDDGQINAEKLRSGTELRLYE